MKCLVQRREQLGDAAICLGLSQGHTGLRAECLLTAHDDRALPLELQVTGHGENNPCRKPLMAYLAETLNLLFPFFLSPSLTLI